jgi:hypothetical protein
MFSTASGLLGNMTKFVAGIDRIRANRGEPGHLPSDARTAIVAENEDRHQQDSEAPHHSLAAR